MFVIIYNEQTWFSVNISSVAYYDIIVRTFS